MAGVITTTKKDIIWNYLSIFFSISSGLLILPIILHFLSSEEVGLNYLLLTITSMVGLMDFGFSPQFGRNITYALSGAQKIEKEGLQYVSSGKPNYHLLGIVIEAAKMIYRRMSIIVLLVMLIFGTPYIYHVTCGFHDINNILEIWLLFCVSSYFNIYFIYYRSLLTGSGKIYESSISIIVSKFIYIVTCGLMLIAGCGLFSVVVANMLAPLAQFAYSHYIFYNKQMRESLPAKQDNSEVKEAITNIWYNAKKLGINQLGTFAILRLNLFLVGLFLPLSVVGSFGLLTQIIQTLSGLSSALFQSFIPQFASLQVKHDVQEIIKKLSVTTIFYWATILLGGLIVIVILPHIFVLIGSSTTLPDISICILYLIVLALEGNHSNFATIIATSNKIPFVKAGLTSGAFIAILTYLSLRFTDLGILGVVVVQGMVQLMYNNWKWPMYVLSDLNCSPWAFMKTGIHEFIFRTQSILKWKITSSI